MAGHTIRTSTEDVGNPSFPIRPSSKGSAEARGGLIDNRLAGETSRRNLSAATDIWALLDGPFSRRNALNLVLWLMYLAGVVEVVSIFLIIGILITLIAVPFIGLIYEYDSPKEKIRYFAKKVWKGLALAVVVAILLPSKTFLYVVAGVTAGETVATTEIAQKAYILLENRLDELLSDD